jgi:putative tryptophan/tyrosine transport system substrate-binding protein
VKQLEVMHELTRPRTGILALLGHPPNVGENVIASAKKAAASLGHSLVVLDTITDSDFAGAFANAKQEDAIGLVVPSDPLFVTNLPQLTALAAHHALPTIYAEGELASTGGLISYGVDISEAFRQMADYVARLLHGAKASELPVNQPAKLPLKVNLKTARMLGLTIPATLLARADEVIE